VNTSVPPPGDLCLVVGYDGSAPANRALDAAARLLRGRTGRIDVVYIAHWSSLEMFSAGAVGEMEEDFDEVEQELRAEAAERLRGREERWGFVRRQGPIAEELITVAAGAREAYGSVAIVVGSSSHAAHRMVGSVAVSLARHSPVPLIIVP
jgi:nucleotide-binding universal stress UspA family protein